jgi:DNA-binding CsgD family transcriptional regulator
MEKSKWIGLADVQAMLRLIGECRELGDDPIVWRQHFCAGLAEMVGADVVTSGEMIGCLSGRFRIPGGTAWGFDRGFNIAGFRLLGEQFAADPLASESFRGVIGELRARPTPGATIPRQQIVPDREWYRSFDYQMVCRTMGTDALVHSFCAMAGAHDHFDGMAVCRAAGGPTFHEREVSLVNLAHQEVARLVGGPLARFDEPAPSRLPPRVRQVLRCLLEGDGDKQVAKRLALSQYTVNQYTKHIYRYFSVNGRTELLARWIRRGWGSKSDWGAAITVVSDSPSWRITCPNDDTHLPLD